MRIFVSEYMCGGAWPEAALDGSLAVEGRAMLLSLLQDLLRVQDVRVVTTWDARLGEFPLGGMAGLSPTIVLSPTDEERQFRRLCEECDAAFVIAPEFHSVLAARVETASARTLLIGCSLEATRQCSDKLTLAAFLADEGILTVPTEPFETEDRDVGDLERELEFPCVVKPRDGAGSTLTFQIDNPRQLTRISRQLQRAGADFQFVRQPFIDGLSVSCAAIVTAEPGRAVQAGHVDVLPPCQQIVSDDSRFRYEGADFPGQLDRAMSDRVEHVVRRCCNVISGLRGYVGFDLLIPHNPECKLESEPVIVDINPRLTTGYLLWRQLCKGNLAARMLESCMVDSNADRPELKWNSATSAFRLCSLSD
ncbi:MAG: ATP-grasp domain-containing protein [Planctomycetota bacterium]|nr:ATP-grasp domain-containing protein [Planctomycetota bacterium]MDA1165167.1 ATP-grasp domain-containing protein [Planctomycetota bacterium]